MSERVVLTIDNFPLMKRHRYVVVIRSAVGVSCAFQKTSFCLMWFNNASSGLVAKVVALQHISAHR